MSHLNINGPIRVSETPATQPAMPAVSPVTVQANPARQLNEVFETSDTWQMAGWTTPALVTSRAALRHMLSLVERELGRRKLMGPTR